ncbi:DUF1559 domain-containing protein [Adhaeretor mobilis]|uniref:DUF1559 domain-containing protein n=1 Tax=Adhaeretor mobilis TaxID=1930276 RepID=A0A517MUD2_9BACT|nr:DUF1559 domain-containing protein [Adhaeretor mobilis]QDS98484.1 hypothetical protein HG15A2_17640 [Adhaeretor mobilis]
MVSRTPRFSRPSIRCGFTLVELLVVIAIIGVLVGLLLPAVQAAREAARRAQCISQMKQVALAMLNYESAFGNFPEGTRTNLISQPEYGEPFPGFKPGNKHDQCSNGPPWTVLILPYIEQQSLFDQFEIAVNEPLKAFPSLYDNCTTSVNQPQGANLGVQTPLNIWHCPSDPIAQSGTLHNCYFACTGGGDWENAATVTPELGFATTSFSGNPNYRIFVNGITSYDSKTKFGQIEDGSSNTFLIGESRVHYLPGSHPMGPQRYAGWSSSFNSKTDFAIPNNAAAASRPINFDPNPGAGDEIVWNSPGYMAATFGSNHPGGAHFAFADGSVANISEDIDEETYWQMGRMADGLPLGGSER